MNEELQKKLRTLYYYDPDELGEDAFKLVGDDEIAEIEQLIQDSQRAFAQELLEEISEDEARDSDNELRNINREYSNQGSIDLILKNIVANSQYRAGINYTRKEIRSLIQQRAGLKSNKEGE